MEAGLLVIIAMGAVAVFLLTRRRKNTEPHASPEAAIQTTPERRRPAQGGLSIPLEIAYADSDGTSTQRRIDVLAVKRPAYVTSNDMLALTAWCHLRNAERTFVTDRIQSAADGTTGEIIPAADIGTWLLMETGQMPSSPTPEAPPGRISTRRPHPPIAAVAEWERSPGDLEVFDVEIDEVELAGGVPFAFSGRAKRRKSATDRAWTGRRRFKLRRSAEGDAPIRALFPEGADAAHPAPHRWLAERTAR